VGRDIRIAAGAADADDGDPCQAPRSEQVSEGPVSYADAGVDLDAADRAVARIAAHAARTRRSEVLDSIGGFGGLFALDTSRWREPVLVSSTDGVGTKTEIARRTGVLDTVGRDLVAMVVDDLVVCGAEPLFFNDYLAVGRLDELRVEALVRGIADGCELAGCALVGGETAEHPGVLAPDAFDLAGFGVGIVERDELLGAHRVVDGDVLIGLASSGLHSNGFSLVRRVVDGLDLDLGHGLDRPLGEELLEPTRIHAPDCLALLETVEVHALCHVTGGGIPGNLPRVLPEGLVADVDTTSWDEPAVFGWLASRGPIADDQMWRTFNRGVGMIAIVAAGQVDDALACLEARDVDAWTMGSVRRPRSGEQAGGVVFDG
jgi:phosphoribosylformylglycinamidine cyclo-ligase